MNTYTKLKNGSWGVRIEAAAKIGSTYLIQKKDGQPKEEKISAVLWTGQDKETGKTISLCAIVSTPRSTSSTAYKPASSKPNGRCRGCGGAIVNAPHHRAMEGYCGHCAFDEFDC